ncbi:MAG TPA: T9SS type A sorting domain-containing protein [Flavipsychrobacter sp.]|nr:T9SS type A sorting domain-containing protein [Flavipsychrobacter sp.]
MRVLYSLLLCCLTQYVQAQCNATITALGPTTFCQGGSVMLVANDGDVYKWYENGNLVAVLTTDTFTVNTTGSYEVVIDSAGCIDTSAAINIIVNTVPPQPGPISRPAIACVFSTNTYTIAPVPGATSYFWYCSFGPLTGTATSAQFQGTTWSTDIFVTAINTCGNSLTSQPFPVTGGTPPTNIGVYLSSNDPLCPGDTKYISTMVVHPGDIFTFYKNGNVVQSGTSQGYGATSSGSYYFTVTNLAGCTAQSSTVAINFSVGPGQPVIVQVGPTLTTTQVYSSWAWYRNTTYVGSGQYYYPTQDGDYKVRVGNSVPCYEESAMYNVSYTGIQELKGREDAIIYPNPTTGAFTLTADLGAEDTASITITDITGRIVKAMQVNIPVGVLEEKIELFDATPGLYLLKLTTENYNKTISFVKQ